MDDENLPEFMHTMEKIKPVRPILIEKFRPEMLYYNEIIDDTSETLTNLPRSMQKMRQYRKICSHMLELLRFKKQNGFYREMTDSMALLELEESLSLLINEMNVISHIENMFGISFEEDSNDNELRSIIDHATIETKRLRKKYLERHNRLIANAAGNAFIQFEESVRSEFNYTDDDVAEEDLQANLINGLEQIRQKIKPLPIILMEKYPALMVKYNDIINELRNDLNNLPHPPSFRKFTFFRMRLQLHRIQLNKFENRLKKECHENQDTVVSEGLKEFEKFHVLLFYEINKVLCRLRKIANNPPAISSFRTDLKN